MRTSYLALIYSEELVLTFPLSLFRLQPSTSSSRPSSSSGSSSPPPESVHILLATSHDLQKACADRIVCFLPHSQGAEVLYIRVLHPLLVSRSRSSATSGFQVPPTADRTFNPLAHLLYTIIRTSTDAYISSSLLQSTRRPSKRGTLSRPPPPFLLRLPLSNLTLCSSSLLSLARTHTFSCIELFFRLEPTHLLLFLAASLASFR